MKVDVIVIPADKDSKDICDERTIISCNPWDDAQKLVLEVQGFGTAEGSVKVSGIRTTAEIADVLCIGEPEAWPKDRLLKIMDLGHAFVWMEPVTWAYAFRDLLNNQ